jgi:hypothetical protein
MSEYFPSQESRALWYDRRAVVLEMLQDALAPLLAEGLETRETKGWALWAKLDRWAVDVSTGMPYASSNTMLVLERVMRANGFSPGKPMLREVRVDFAPDSSRLTEAGEAAMAEVTECLIRFLREGPVVKLGADGKPAKRKPRGPTKAALAARATYAKAIGQ